jgi:hypothetical protein
MTPVYRVLVHNKVGGVGCGVGRFAIRNDEGEAVAALWVLVNSPTATSP